MKNLFVLIISTIVAGEMFVDVCKTSYSDLTSAKDAGIELAYNMARKINNSPSIKGVAYVKKAQEKNVVAKLHYNSSVTTFSLKEIDMSA